MNTNLHDLLDNFETWTPEMQQSFLELVSSQVIEEQATVRAANLTLLDQLHQDFSEALLKLHESTVAFADELDSSIDAERFRKDFLERDEFLARIRTTQKWLTRLEDLLK